jgi:hypothetical protein
VPNAFRENYTARCDARHFFSAGLPSGYFARSACHFLTSSGLFVAVYSSISASRASGIRLSAPPDFGIDLSSCFIPCEWGRRALSFVYEG